MSILFLSFFVLSASASKQTDFLEKLSFKYAPSFRSHQDEKYSLANAEWYLKHVGLALKNSEGDQEILIEPGQVTIKKLESLFVNINGKKEPVMQKDGSESLLPSLYFFIPEENYESIIKAEGAKPVVYAYPRYIKNGDEIDISYIFFQAYNGTVGSGLPCCSLFFHCLGVGNHEGDWEHITVRLDKTGQNIIGVHYASHGTEEGIWYTESNRDLDSKKGYKISESGQIITFSTLDTHGNHNRPGRIRREPPSIFKKLLKYFGVLIERTSNDGEHVDCRDVLEIFPENNPAKYHPWLKFRGLWGNLKAKDAPLSGAGPSGPLFKDWTKQEVGNDN